MFILNNDLLWKHLTPKEEERLSLDFEKNYPGKKSPPRQVAWLNVESKILQKGTSWGWPLASWLRLGFGQQLPVSECFFPHYSIPWASTPEGSRRWLATHGEVSDCSLQPGSALVVVGIYGMNQYMEDYSLSPSHCLSNKMRINSKALKNSDCSSVLLLVFSVMINLCFRNVRVSSSKKRSTIILSSPCKNPGVLGFQCPWHWYT